MKTRLALAALPLAFLAACGTTGTAEPSPGQTVAPSEAEPGTTTSPATPAATSAATPADSGSPQPSELAPPTSMNPVKAERGPSTPPTVTGVRFAGHDGYDRVVIELDGPMTGYTADWVDKLVQDGSGAAMNVRGGAYLQLTLVPASAHDIEGKPTWTGPRKVAAKLPNVVQIVNNGDFEGVVSIGLVLDHKAAFRVIEQSKPTRLVIDVAR